MVKLSPIITSVLLLILFLYVALFASSINVISSLNILSALVFSYSIYKKQGTLLSPFLFILLSLYVFHSGQLWLSLFSPDPIRFLAQFDYAVSEAEFVRIYRLLTLLLMCFGFVGYLLLQKKLSVPPHDTGSFEPSWSFRLFVDVAFVIMMYFEIVRANNVSLKGYGSGYLYTNDFATMLSDWVDVLLITMMYTYRNRRGYFLKYAGMLLLRALFVMFFVGNRGASMIAIIVLLFITSQYSVVGENKARMRLWVLIFIVFVLNALPLISITRQGVSSDSAFSESGPLTAFFVEFGDTARNMFLVDGYLSSSEPVYGLQILTTSLTIIPLSTFLFGDLIHQYGLVTLFLNDYYNIKGLGGSLFAQLYYNFGNSIWLYVATGLMAILSAWVSNRLVCRRNSIYQIIIFLSLFAGLMTNVRSEWYSTMSSLKIALYLCLYLFLFKRGEIASSSNRV